MARLVSGFAEGTTRVFGAGPHSVRLSAVKRSKTTTKTAETKTAG